MRLDNSGEFLESLEPGSRSTRKEPGLEVLSTSFEIAFRVEKQCVESRYVTCNLAVSLYCVIVLLAHILKHKLLCFCSTVDKWSTYRLCHSGL